MSGSGSHYYDDDGNLIDKVPYKDKKRPGEMRATTVTDARALNLNPSVTTFLTVQSKPMVERWKIEQAVLATMKEPWAWQSQPEEYVKLMASKADEYADQAAEFGTQIHNMVCNLLGGRRYISPIMFPGANQIADGVVFWLRAKGYEVLETEHTFVNKRLGYAGTIDLRCRRPNNKIVRMDIKTNDFIEEKKCPFYFEHQVQLAGYDIGDEADEDDELEVLYVSRKNIGLIVPKLVTEPTKARRAFFAAAHHWSATHNWHLPRAFYLELMKHERRKA